jgi:hypothetical protein
VNTSILKEKAIQIHYYYNDEYIKNRGELDVYVNPDVVHLHTLSEKPESAIELWMSNKIGEIVFCKNLQIYMDAFYAQLVKILGLEGLGIGTSLFQQEDYLLDTYTNLDPKFHDLDILVLNTPPGSNQFEFDQGKFDALATRLSERYKVVVINPVNDLVSTRADGLTLRDIGAISTHAKYIIGMNSGPLIPCFNMHAKNSVKKWILFHSRIFNGQLEEIFHDVVNDILSNPANVNTADQRIP